MKVIAKILNWAQNNLWAAMCPYKSVQVRRILVFYVFVRYNTCTRILIIIIHIFIRILVVIILFYYFQIIFLKENIFLNLNFLDARVASRDWSTTFS